MDDEYHAARHKNPPMYSRGLNINAGRLLNQEHLNNEGNKYYPADKT